MVKTFLFLAVLAAATLAVLGRVTGPLGNRSTIDRKGYARALSIRYAARPAR